MIIVNVEKSEGKMFVTKWVYRTKEQASKINEVPSILFKFSESEVPSDFFKSSHKYFIEDRIFRKMPD